jgi:hypothetical protein
VFRDAWSLARRDDENALLGQVWATVTMLMTFGLIYKSVFSMSEIGYLFWFFTGVVASRAVEHRREGLARPYSRRPEERFPSADGPALPGPEPVYRRG